MNLLQRIGIGAAGLVAIVAADHAISAKTGQSYLVPAGYAAEAAVLPQGFAESITKGQLDNYLNNSSERLDRKRQDDALTKIPGAETTVRCYDGDKYRFWTFQLENGKTYGFEMVDRKTGVRQFYYDEIGKGNFIPSSLKIDFNPKAYGY